ncbi:hypothetical protein [Paraliobacillus sp. JSM ZJ581]|uniref:hypothetical protein n=1 Tax=Paraliobacillus sp. JSM ZJ581 TaxID=3342118 RepID=UPI0035A8B1BB
MRAIRTFTDASYWFIFMYEYPSRNIAETEIQAAYPENNRFLLLGYTYGASKYNVVVK